VDVEEIGRGQNIEGPLFGGCFTVLSALIGTPYFPKTLAGHLVFVEDTDESPARLMRALNQWLQAGALAGVKALVVGHLRGLGDKVPDSAPFVLREFARRTGLPVFHAPACGHTSPNEALMIGAQGVVAGGRLSWRLAPPASGRTLA
jgi:muramoyltetrapeptide carboxypeptidase